MKEKSIYMPGHPNSNIHGIVGVDGNSSCYTNSTSQTLCTGCCYALHVEDDQSGFYKEAGNDCEKRIPSQGCKFIKENLPGRPNVCQGYHCSFHKGVLRESPDTQERLKALQSLSMCNEAAHLFGEVTQKEKLRNQTKHIGTMDIPIIDDDD